MRFQFYCLLVLLLLTNDCFAQHVEYNFGAGTGLFHFVSDKYDRIEPFYSMLNADFDPGFSGNPYVNDPHGDKSGFSFQSFATLKKITKHNFLWGLDAEFQSLQSKKKLQYVFADSIYDATGQSKVTDKYLDLFPFFGKRIIIKKMYLDITGGFELAMSFFGAREKAKAKITSTHQILVADITSRSNNDVEFLPWDGRFRLQSLLGGYKKWGMSLGYAWGLSNMDGEAKATHSHSRYAQIGIVYTLYGKHKTKLH